MLAYSHGTSTIPLIGQTIGENLRETARRFPERDALVVPFQRVRLTYADFDSTVDRLALSLLGAGIARGIGSASGVRTTLNGWSFSTPRRERVRSS